MISSLPLAMAGGHVMAAPESAASPARQDHQTSIIGHITRHVTRESDTLLDIARANKLGFVEMLAANPGIDPWVPGAGKNLVLPTAHLLPSGPREGLVVNLIDQRLYYFLPDGPPISVPIGSGAEGWGTPTGTTRIVRKKRNPSWYVPKSIRAEQPDLPPIVKPGPDNPLGKFAMYFDWPSYLIHGTNNPWGVGRRVSHGCIRLYPEDIAALFPRIKIGTKVTVVKEAVKMGWHDGMLWLEAHPSAQQIDEIEVSGRFSPAMAPDYIYRLVQLAGPAKDRLHWPTIRAAILERRGLPIAVLSDKAPDITPDIDKTPNVTDAPANGPRTTEHQTRDQAAATDNSR